MTTSLDLPIWFKEMKYDRQVNDANDIQTLNNLIV